MSDSGCTWEIPRLAGKNARRRDDAVEKLQAFEAKLARYRIGELFGASAIQFWHFQRPRM